MDSDKPGEGTTQGSLGVRKPGQKEDGTWPRVVIVYESVHHGNTKKMAVAMAESISADVRKNTLDSGTPPANVFECLAIDARNAKPDDFASADIIGFGSGIYFFRHHRRLIKFVDSLPVMSGKSAFIFSTKGGGPSWYYDRSLRRALGRRGFNIIGSRSWLALDTYGIWRTVFGGLNKGHPDSADLKEAGEWAKEMVLKA